MEAVELWNVGLNSNQERLRRLVGETAALELNNYETDRGEVDNPQSLHGKFYVAHNAVLRLLRCKRSKDCEVSQSMIRSTNKMLRDLDYNADFFLEKFSFLFLKRAEEIENVSDFGENNDWATPNK